MPQENVGIARRLMAAWSRRDVEAAIELLHEDIEWRPALTAGGVEGAVYRGAAGIRKWFSELDDVWAELSIEIAEFREVGEDRVLQLGQFHAVGKESGVPIDQAQAILLTIADGRVIAGWGFASHEEAINSRGAIGVAPQRETDWAPTPFWCPLAPTFEHIRAHPRTSDARDNAHPCPRGHRFTRERSVVRNQPRPSTAPSCREILRGRCRRRTSRSCGACWRRT
jgi:ketosteroid isomerase-like protein